MKQTALLIFVVCLTAFSNELRAQTIDLQDLRIRPDSTKLTINKPEMKPTFIEPASSTLDMKVIYWRHWSSFGINANQAAFSDNWNAGEIGRASCRERGEVEGV